MIDAKYLDHNGASTRVDGNAAKHNPHTRAAIFCLLYLLLLLVLFSWQLFDTWIERHSLLRGLHYDLTRLNTSGFRLIAFTVIGGGLGGIVNGIRSVLNYCDGFHQRYAWKYLFAPWMGATLALFVYALLRSSIVIFGGSANAGDVSTAQVLSNFAAGALAGYGSKDVFIWLDANVHKIFRVAERVPDVTGKPQEAAISRLHSANLELGEVSKVHQDDKRAGTVIDQSPPPEAPIDRGESVDIAVAANSRTN